MPIHTIEITGDHFMLEINAPAGILHFEYDFGADPIEARMVDVTMDTTWAEDLDAPIPAGENEGDSQGPKVFLKKVLAGSYETTACRTLSQGGQKLRLSFRTTSLADPSKAEIRSYQDFERTG